MKSWAQGPWNQIALFYSKTSHQAGIFCSANWAPMTQKNSCCFQEWPRSLNWPMSQAPQPRTNLSQELRKSKGSAKIRDEADSPSQRSGDYRPLPICVSAQRLHTSYYSEGRASRWDLFPLSEVQQEIYLVRSLVGYSTLEDISRLRSMSFGFRST